MAIVALIPARFGSTRLPGKPLSEIQGKPMIQHVYERARLARRPDRVMVATDDERIASAVRAFGGEVRMTSPHHRSGTDRLAEAVTTLEAAIIVNVQGDEPLLDPAAIDLAVDTIIADETLDMSTLCVPITDPRETRATDVVKVVTNARGDALYFSRSPIPFASAAGEGEGAAPMGRKHVGLYVYRRLALERLAALPPSPLEQAESLEQLRALHYGMRIGVAELPAGAGSVAVDTAQDLERVRAIMARVPMP